MSFVHNVEELIEAHGSGLTSKAAHWERVRLGDVAQVINGFPFPSGGFNTEAGEPVLRIRDITAGSVGTFFKGDIEGAPRVEHGDLVVGMDGDFNSLLWPGERALINQRVCKIAPDEDVYSKNLLAYALPGYLKLVNDHTSAVTVKHLSSRTIAALPLPLPPRPEQDRLASKLDELFSRIDEGGRALERVQKLLERYRQSVLKAAVTGELTREWREKNKDKLESGEALLARILKARREAWEKAELAKMKAKGITPANNKWKQKYEEPVPPDTSDLPELPPGWVYVNIDVLVEPIAGSIRRGPFGSTLTKSIFVSSGYKVYEQQHAIGGDFTAGRYYIDEKKYQELSSFWLRPGDLIVSCSGTVGRVATVPEDAQPGVMNQALLKLTLARTVMSRDFFKLAFAHRLASFSSRGSGMNNFSGIDELKKMPFPLAPLEEQGEVLQQAERQFSVTDHQTAELERQQKVVNSLRQAVLREGFRGALVSQDPTDEPASVLLRRIAAERGTDNAAPKRGRKKKTAA